MRHSENSCAVTNAVWVFLVILAMIVESEELLTCFLII